MKKYVKPELFYEHYELSQHIADCAWEWVNMKDATICRAEADSTKLPIFAGPDYLLFASEGICTLFQDDLEDFCYQNGGPNANLFDS